MATMGQGHARGHGADQEEQQEPVEARKQALTGRTGERTGGPCDRRKGHAPDLFHQLTLTILDRSVDEGLRTIKSIRSYLDTWEPFLQDRKQLLDHLLIDHKASPPDLDADPVSLNRRHWQAHGNDLASFLAAHPIRA
jgi:hypothetical protein